MHLEPYQQTVELVDREGRIMTEERSRQLLPGPSRWSGTKIALFWGGGLTLFALVIVYGLQRIVGGVVAEERPERAAVATQGTSEAEAATVAAVAELNTLRERQKVTAALSAERSKLALARAEATRLLALSEEVRTTLEQTRRLRENWHRLQEELLQSEQGRRLATDRAAVVTLMEEFGADRVGGAKLESMTAALDELVRPAKESRDLEAGAVGNYEPDEAIFTQLHELQAEARGIAASYRQAEETVRGLLRGAGEVGALTLAEAIEAEQARRARDIAQQRAERIDQVLQETLDQRLAEEEAGVRALVAEQVGEMRAEREKREKQARLQELVAKAQREGVAEQLAAFTTPGYYVYLGDDLEEKQPYSLGHLRGLGALSPTKSGLQKLYMVGHYHRDRERPRWNWGGAGRVFTPEAEARIREMQDLLNEYGEALVEMGQLTP